MSCLRCSGYCKLCFQGYHMCLLKHGVIIHEECDFKTASVLEGIQLNFLYCHEFCCAQFGVSVVTIIYYKN